MIGIDYEVKDWLTRLRADGYDALPSEVIALSRFVKRAKANGYWTKLFEVYPFCGTSLECCLYKLKYPSTLLSKATWGGSKVGAAPTEANYSPRMGFKGPGSGSGYMISSDFIPSVHCTPGVGSYMSIRVRYGNENDLNRNENLFGNNGTPGAFSISLNSNSFQTQNDHTTNLNAADAGDQYGYLQSNRIGDNVYFFRDGVSMGGATPQASTGLSTSSVNITGRANYQESSYIFSFAAFGEGMTDTNCENMGVDVLSLMSDLRRV